MSMATIIMLSFMGGILLSSWTLTAMENARRARRRRRIREGMRR